MQEKRKLNEVMDVFDMATVDNFLREAFKFCTTPSLLGRVTNYCERLAYAENRVSSNTLHLLYDLHDLLVDAPKQGYSFSNSDFGKFVFHTLKIRKEPPEPAYKIDMENSEKALRKWPSEDTRINPPEHNPNNVTDILYFEVMKCHNKETRQLVTNAFSDVEKCDPDLQYPFKRLREKHNAVIDQELDSLVSRFGPILDKWNNGAKKNLNKEPGSDCYDGLIDDCYKDFQALQPIRKDHPDINPWLIPYLSKDFSIWETIRASALYTTYPMERRAYFVFHMAGRELAELKASSLKEKPRTMVAHIHANIKPKPIRITTRASDDTSDDDFAMVAGAIEDDI
jgi:hypothetical protein